MRTTRGPEAAGAILKLEHRLPSVLKQSTWQKLSTASKTPHKDHSDIMENNGKGGRGGRSCCCMEETCFDLTSRALMSFNLNKHD